MPWDVNHEMVQLQRPTQPPWHGHLVDLHPFQALCPCRDLLQLVSASTSAPKLCFTATTVYSWMGKMEKAQHCQLCRCMLEHWKWSRFTYIYIYIYIYLCNYHLQGLQKGLLQRDQSVPPDRCKTKPGVFKRTLQNLF